MKLNELYEFASSGATSAGAIAAVPGALGAGFDPDGDWGIYTKKKKKDKKDKKEDTVLRRIPLK